MDYDEAVAFIESTYRFGSRPGLETITRLFELMGKPYLNFRAVHAAGTNGKGSTCAYIASILGEAGFLTGLYTSPHLERFTERIRVSGEEIGRQDVAQITGAVKQCIQSMQKEGFPHPTEFEVITAIGFEYFKRKGVQYAVVEVGMGGRLDATNVITPEISVITPISIDHVNVLGRDEVSIAREKAGIIKEGIPVICGPQKREVREAIWGICDEREAPFIYTGEGLVENQRPDNEGQAFDFSWQGKVFKEIRINLIGRYQADNAALALAACLQLGISEHAIREGLRKTKWPGRMEVLRKNPLVLIDGAHNVEGAKALAEGLKQFFPGKKVLLVLGMLKDKDVDGVARILASYADRVVTVSPLSARAMDPCELKGIVEKYNESVVCADSVNEVVQKYMVSSEDEIMVFSGSLYMIGEARRLLPPEIL